MIVRATTGCISILFLLGTIATSVPGPDTSYPQDYFRSPLGIPLRLAGNFAEMRDNHFHGGLDLKTNDAEGYRVYAAADGYISRVKVSPFGYGNALYVAHPNGFTTVYAHVAEFRGRIAGHVRRLQYSRKSFAVDHYLKENQFPVKKGDVIALSGNSGSSTGPHLHFEIRATTGQVPVNPLLFGFDVTDTRPPRIFRVRVYPLDSDSGVRATSGRETLTAAGKDEHVTIDTKTVQGVLSLDTDRIEAWGRIGLGLQTHDYHEGSGSRLGAYRITLTDDDGLLMQSTMEKVSFGDTRFINAHVDYAERKERRRWIQRSFVLPGNGLPIYDSRDSGIVQPTEGARTTLRYVVEDAHGNSTRLDFVIVGIQPPAVASADKASAFQTNGHSQSDGHTNGGASRRTVSVRHTQPLVFRDQGIVASFPARSFYENFELEYDREPTLDGTFAPLHVLHTPLVPIHRNYDLSISAPNLPARLRNKAVILTVDSKGRRSSAGGTYEAGLVKTRVRSFGKFTVAVDTIPPAVRSLSLADGDRVGRLSTARFRIDDELSGIAKYNVHLDGKWILFAYDAKRKTIYGDLGPELESGPHELVVTVEDRKENVARLAVSFVK